MTAHPLAPLRGTRSGSSAWRRTAVFLVVGAIAGMSVGIAAASISATGSGTGTATVSAGRTVMIDAAVQDPSGALLPGQSADATFAVDNPNNAPVTIVSVVSSGTITVTGAGCTLANAGVHFTNQTTLSISVPANATDYQVELPGSVSMTTSAVNACQNAYFNIPVTVTAEQ